MFIILFWDKESGFVPAKAMNQISWAGTVPSGVDKDPRAHVCLPSWGKAHGQWAVGEDTRSGILLSGTCSEPCKLLPCALGQGTCSLWPQISQLMRPIIRSIPYRYCQSEVSKYRRCSEQHQTWSKPLHPVSYHWVHCQPSFPDYTPADICLSHS